MSFFDTLKQYGLWPTPQAGAAANPYGLDEDMMRQARMQSLSNIGAQIMAASVRQTPQQRAELMANFDPTGGYQESLMNAAQMKILGQKMRQQQQTDDRKAAAKSWLTQKIETMPDSVQKRNAMIYLQLGDVEKAAAALTAQTEVKPTELKTVKSGDKEITYQWDGKQWAPFSEGLAFKPDTPQPPSSVKEYEYAKQQGYEGTYEDFLKMATAAKAGVALPAEMGARMGLGDEFLTNDLPDIKKDVEAGIATGPLDALTGWAGYGRSGEIRRRLLTGVDALRRNLTGAGMGQGEAEEYVQRYLPTMTDDAENLMSKIDGLERDLKAAKSGAIAAKTGTMTENAQPAPGRRLKFNPETGELE